MSNLAKLLLGCACLRVPAVLRRANPTEDMEHWYCFGKFPSLVLFEAWPPA